MRSRGSSSTSRSRAGPNRVSTLPSSRMPPDAGAAVDHHVAAHDEVVRRVGGRLGGEVVLGDVHEALQLRERPAGGLGRRSEEHTSELPSRLHLVFRLLIEKKKNKS